MSADFLLKTAAVLEAAAEVLDAQEQKTQTAVKTARESAFKELSSQYSALTGEELPVDVAQKLAASDETVLGAVRQVFTKTAGTVESLGRSADTASASQPASKKDAVAVAWNKFGTFINS